MSTSVWFNCIFFQGSKRQLQNVVRLLEELLDDQSYFAIELHSLGLANSWTEANETYTMKHLVGKPHYHLVPHVIRLVYRLVKDWDRDACSTLLLLHCSFLVLPTRSVAFLCYLSTDDTPAPCLPGTCALRPISIWDGHTQASNLCPISSAWGANTLQVFICKRKRQ